MSTPKEQWPTTEALIYSVDRVHHNREYFDCYEVVYSYRIAGERFTGQFDDYVEEEGYGLRPGDTISISYCPENPAEAFYPEAHGREEKDGQTWRIWCITMAVALAIFFLIRWLFPNIL